MTTRETWDMNKRLAELVLDFPRHPAAQDTGAEINFLDEGYAEIRFEVTEKFLVRCDAAPGMIVQGGYTMGVFPDFAAVLAAMTLSKGHALLVSGNFVIPAKATIGETLIAKARAERKKRNIVVSWSVENMEEEVKAKGTYYFRLAKSEEAPVA